MIKEINNTSHFWLKNSIWALALAGLYSIILVMLRTPWVSEIFTDKSIFKSSLIIHVNLSVLVWLLSVTCIIWSTGKRYIFDHVFCKLGFVGTLLMATSPLFGENNPVMNNYVPILENIWFIIGLSLFACQVFCLAVLVVVDNLCHRHCEEAISRRGNPQNYMTLELWGFLRNGLLRRASHFLAMTMQMPLTADSQNSLIKLTSSLMYILTWICFILSYHELSKLSEIVPMDISYYYELLFWSGGHYLQFIYTQIVMFVWLVLAEVWLQQQLRYHKIYRLLFGMNFLLSTLIFYGHYKYQLPDYEFKEFFTNHMKYCGGIAPILLIIVLIIDILGLIKRSKDRRVSLSGTALITSVLLFGMGGGIGMVISGVNTSIPAHYHGSIVGISIAFMGFVYIRCYGDKFSSINYKWPIVQLWMIAIGQVLHIGGLALAGGYGVLRKNPDEEIPAATKFYMAMVGGGGLIAIIGGLMFVYICVRVMAFKRLNLKL